MCGNQRKLRSAISEAFRGSGRVHVLGYTEYMHELMNISFCLLTKAGGITLTEALAMSLPAIVYRPLPGQEAGNAEALEAGNLLDVAYHEDQLIAQLCRLEEPAYRAERLRAMKSFTKPSSAEVIADEVAQVLEKRQAGSRQGWLSLTEEEQAPEVHGVLE
ncbi:Processive diacylglycerol beta-glucosyltransferase [compost metagenome]